MVQQKAVAAIDGQIFRGEARIVPGPQPPDENALEVGVAEGQNGLFTVKGANQLAQDQPKGFRHAAVHFEQPRELRQKLLLGGVAPLAAA